MACFKNFSVACATIALGLTMATGANAVLIDMGFTADADTIITGTTSTNDPAASPSKDDFINSTTTAATFNIDLAPFGLQYSGETLDVTGARSSIPGGSSTMRLTRSEGAGLQVCSQLNTGGSACLTGGTPENPLVDGAGTDESIHFAISTGREFTVRYIEFGSVDSDDIAKMLFSTSDGADELDIDLDFFDANPDVDYSTCISTNCTIDVYKLVAGARPGLFAYNAATDAAGGYDNGNNDAFNAFHDLSSPVNYFQYKAVVDTDDWTIRRVRLVTKLPEPGSVSLLGAGLLGLGWFRFARRRTSSRAA